MDVLAVIVNYRTAELTEACLASVSAERQLVAGLRVALVENGSKDGSAERLLSAIASSGWDEWIDFIELEENRGFAYGNNAAIRPALDAADPPACILLLNPDTVVRPGGVKALVDFMEAHPDAGIAGSRLEEPDGTPQISAFRFPTIFGELEAGLRLGLATKLLGRWTVPAPLPKEACEMDWVSGASMLVRRAVFEECGLLDEGYFLYFEDPDFCLAARRNGWPCWYLPESRVVHLGSQATGVYETRQKPKRRPRYWFESRRRYFVKNHGVWYAACADIAWILGFVLWRMRRVVQRKQDQDPPKLLADFIRHSVLMPGRQP